MRGHAAAGAVVWLVVVALAVQGRFWVLEPALLLAPLVLVPLTLDLITGSATPRLLRAVQPVAALLATASFFMPRGKGAALLAGGWMAFTLLLALLGLQRLARRGLRDVPELAIDAGLLLVPVGGAWLVASRLGATLGFQEPIVLLTAVHFHYTALVGSVLLGLAGRGLGSDRSHAAIVGATIGGTLLTAVGITFDARLEFVAVVVVSLALWGFAVWLWRRRNRLPPGAGRVLVTLSALSVLPSMGAALGWAGQALGHPLVALSWMVRLHGPLNALGFCLCGLVGWTLLATQPSAAVPVDMVRRDT